ncbi:CDP-diacylglycerol--serine O-phosphatidyltransferase [Sulfoacidibacillus thermotolerans]|uniref:CDP-diacylglycerol--serine O-phosphatidyltransferase n=1 Tax=Sulfoacidibacillus thermotolerans TaxID=1765684 RepID=A0A2U3DBE2_SULT2|nr:CDP-diacylglycerol--serine O-phosphatidyltransferase [Sulfoacidibacillus thermotolerans]PWI58597.1 CDP-diacylglycerol--serine O-phosphatidyltransferase [Sulfoacidibacillus thermotolerans]
MRNSLANLLTLLNLILGMVSLMLSVQGSYEVAALFVIVGMAFDGLDGRVARALGISSEFGKQLDSLSDIVTFGIAPSIIMWDVVLRNLGVLGAFIACAFPVAGALRLARFNVQTGQRHYFIGLPITAAGGILATFALYHGLIPTFWLPLLTLALSYLMVSKTKYPNFKHLAVPRFAYVVVPFLAIVVAFVLIHHRNLVARAIFIVLALYGGYGVWYDLHMIRKRRARRRDAYGSTHE